jgi:hypothetical protein
VIFIVLSFSLAGVGFLGPALGGGLGGPVGARSPIKPAPRFQQILRRFIGRPSTRLIVSPRVPHGGFGQVVSLRHGGPLVWPYLGSRCSEAGYLEVGVRVERSGKLAGLVGRQHDVDLSAALLRRHEDVAVVESVGQ